MKKPVVLTIMDGFGINPETKGNAIKAAKTPRLDKIFAEWPTTQIGASGMDVGLPDGQMGNSEVGHTNIGAGRIVYQELTRITKSIKDGDFFENEAFLAAAKNCKENGSALLTSADYTSLNNQIKMFKNGFSASNFGNVYNFKTSIDNKLLELYEELALEQVSNGSSSFSLDAQKAPFSGLVTYYQDGYESVDVKNLTPELFDKTVYTKQSLKSDGQVSAGSAVCKLINDEEWNIAISLSKDEFDKVTQNEYASFTINNSSRKIRSTYDKIEKDGHYYIVVSFNKYIAQYVNERFLDINFMFEESSGLKIPASSVITKDVYMIPVDYLTGGSGDSDLTHFNQVTYGNSGSTSIKQISPIIYFTDKRFCYVDPSSIDSDAVLQKNNSKDTFSVATAAKYTMDGVLCVSRGTAEFRRIEVIVSGDDYSIIKPDLSYGISRYDRILLDGHSMKEGELIYQ